MDVAQGALLADRTVLVRGRRIVAVASEEVATSAGATVVDGTGRYLIPGLWDMHVHTTDPASLAHSVAHGVTGVRDMGGDAEQPTDGCESVHLDSLLAWRARITSGHRVGPRLLLAGPAVSGTGWPTSLPARTPDEARRAVATLRAAGVDFVKVYEGVPLEAYRTLAAAARAAGLPLAGHVPGETVSLAEAVRAGHRSIEHVRDAMLVCFTDEDAFVRDSRRRALPAPVRQAFDVYVRAKRAQPPEKRVGERRWWRMQQRLVGRMGAAGAAILACSDAACEGGLPGASLHEELALLVASGLTPLQALQAATLHPARYLNAADSLGAVAPGMVTDLVLLDANPLTDIRNSTRIRGVVRDGRWLARTELDERR